MKVCEKCGKEVNRLATRSPRLCMNCYKKENLVKWPCKKCGKLYFIGKNTICQKCKNYKRPKDFCYICNKFKNVVFRDNDNPICRSCYNMNYRPNRKCKKCGKLQIINGNGLCKKCYKTKSDFCNICHRHLQVHTIKENKVICKSCYNSWRAAIDENFSILLRLRCRVRDAFRSYSKSGKIRKSDEYGINYKKIIEHLGPCPGNIKEYHIDHIKPLCLFNFTKLEEIKLAFAPDNHQWLKAEENLKKSNKII